MNYTIEGTIIQVFEEKKTASASFKDFILKTNEQYPQTLKFSIRHNKFTEQVFDKLPNYLNCPAKVSFNISGKEWNQKFYVQLNAWSIEVGKKSVEQYVEEVQKDGIELPF